MAAKRLIAFWHRDKRREIRGKGIVLAIVSLWHFIIARLRILRGNPKSVLEGRYFNNLGRLLVALGLDDKNVSAWKALLHIRGHH